MKSLLCVLVIGVSSSSAAPPSAPSWVLRGTYSPSIDPANFVRTVDNRYFPLKAGTTFHFVGAREAAAQTDDMVVTGQTKRVLRVVCTVVRDTVSEHGQPVERTFDWYAQDTQGNVWYMGEDSLERKNGHFVRARDSWQAGVNDAKPGIIMQAIQNPAASTVRSTTGRAVRSIRHGCSGWAARSTSPSGRSDESS